MWSGSLEQVRMTFRQVAHSIPFYVKKEEGRKMREGNHFWFDNHRQYLLSISISLFTNKEFLKEPLKKSHLRAYRKWNPPTLLVRM